MQVCVEALDECTAVYAVPVSHLTRLIASHPALARRLLDQLGGQLAQAHARLAEMTLNNVKTRLAHTLAQLARRDHGHIVWATHAQLALIINTGPQEVARALRHLVALHLIDCQPHRHGITVLDPDALAAM